MRATECLFVVALRKAGLYLRLLISVCRATLSILRMAIWFSKTIPSRRHRVQINELSPELPGTIQTPSQDNKKMYFQFHYNTTGASGKFHLQNASTLMASFAGEDWELYLIESMDDIAGHEDTREVHDRELTGKDDERD